MKTDFSNFLSAAATCRRRPRLLHAVAAAATALILAACGGGGDPGGPGATPTGVTVGTITGFGSIVVDGVRYDDKNARVTLDTVAGAPDDNGARLELKLGQRVELGFKGIESASSADDVTVSAEIVGPVTAIAPDLVVAGQTVKVNTDPALGPVTTFEGYASAADIAIGDRVEVHGMATGPSTVQATRIERKPGVAAWLRVTGNITDLASDGASFKLGGLTVNLDTNTRVVPAGATLANGLRVTVWSRTAPAAGSITAAFVRVKRPHAEGDLALRLSGAVTDCTVPCEGSFKVAGVPVNASDATFVKGTKADLLNGKWVDLRGSIDATSGVFKASRVKFREADEDRNEVKLRGAITDFVDLQNFKVRGVPVTTDGSTRIEGSCPNPLADGTLVSIEGSVNGFNVLAAKIECFTSAEGVTLETKGTIDTLNADTKSFTFGGSFAGNLTIRWTDTTEFPEGKTAADLRAGMKVFVKGNVEGGVLTATRIRFGEDDGMPPAPPGVALFETEGIASGVTKVGADFTGLTVNGLAIVIETRTLVLTRDGPLVDGAKVKVVFVKDGERNVALLVRTDD
jgi:hypothetical protein